MLVGLCGSLEGLGNNVEIVARGLGCLDSLLRSLGGIGGTGVGTRSSPSALTSSKDTVDHVDPVEEGVDDEHEGVQHDLVATELGAKVQHEKPIKPKRDGDETDGEVGHLLRSGDQGDDQDEEEQGGGTNGVLHETDDQQDRVALPQADICQHAHFVCDKTQEPATTLLEQRGVLLHSLGLAECSRVHLDQVTLLCANHEQMGEPAVLAQMALAVVEEIVTLLGLVSEVVFGHSAESRESQHGQSTGETGDGTAARFDRTLEQLTVDVFHILEQGDERVLVGGGRNDTSLRQHVLLAAGLELHLVHEVLNAGLVENAVGVDEEDKQVVVALEVLGVDFVDELEGPLLAMALTAVGEARHGDTTAAVDDVDGLWVGVEGERHAELFDGVEVQLVLLVSVKGEEDVQAGRRVFAVDERVAGTEENLWDFLVTRHDDDDLWRRSLVENGFDSASAANRVSDELVDTEQPGNRQETGKGPEGEPLQKVDHLLRKVLCDLGRERQGDDHDWQEDGTGSVRGVCSLQSRGGILTGGERRGCRRRRTECAR